MQSVNFTSLRNEVNASTQRLTPYRNGERAVTKLLRSTNACEAAIFIFKTQAQRYGRLPRVTQACRKGLSEIQAGPFLLLLNLEVVAVPHLKQSRLNPTRLEDAVATSIGREYRSQFPHIAGRA